MARQILRALGLLTGLEIEMHGVLGDQWVKTSTIEPGPNWERCPRPEWYSTACAQWGFYGFPEPAITHMRVSSPSNPTCLFTGGCGTVPDNEFIVDYVPGVLGRHMWLYANAEGYPGTAPNPWFVVRQYRAISPGPQVIPYPYVVPDPRGRAAVYPSDEPLVHERRKIRPRLKPYERPAWEFELDPRRPPDTPVGRPVVHGLFPPGPELPERKWKVPYGRVGRLYGWVSELKEVADCAAKNIPGEPCKGMSLGDKVACIAANSHKMSPEDWGGFQKCLREGRAGDRVVAKFNRLANRITRDPYWRRPVGPGAGAWGHRMR